MYICEVLICLLVQKLMAKPSPNSMEDYYPSGNQELTPFTLIAGCMSFSFPCSILEMTSLDENRLGSLSRLYCVFYDRSSPLLTSFILSVVLQMLRAFFRLIEVELLDSRELFPAHLPPQSRWCSHTGRLSPMKYMQTRYRISGVILFDDHEIVL